MDFTLTADQEELRRAAEGFLSAECDSLVVRAAFEGDDDVVGTLWRKVCDLGWNAIGVPEVYGGLGLGWVETVLVAQEMGRFLFPGPYMPVVLSIAGLLALADEGTRENLLPRLIDGSLVATVTVPMDGSVVATEGKHGVVLNGVALAPYGQSADLFLVRVGSGGFALVERGAPGCSTEAMPVVDRARVQAAVRFDGVSTERVYRTDGSDPLESGLLLYIAAEQSGITGRCLEMSVDYAKTRHQFGRPIGAFQAISHKIADMYLGAEHSRSLLYYAAWAADEATQEADRSGPLHRTAEKAIRRAAIWSSEAALRCTAEAIQVHGGIGFTWEHDLHMYFKRARSNHALLPDTASLAMANV